MVGSVQEGSDAYPEIVVYGPNKTEAFHVRIGILEEAIWRWGVLTNVSIENVGDIGDGTTIDFDEPFQIT